MSQSLSSRIQTYVRNDPVLFAKCKWLSGSAEGNALLGLLINLLAPELIF